MADIKFEGLYELQMALKENITLDDVKKVVKQHGSQLQRGTQRKADFKKGYQTGATKRSIGLEITDGGMTAEVEPGTDYAAYVELGTRKMSAQPFVKPAWEEQKEKFKNDLDKLMK